MRYTSAVLHIVLTFSFIFLSLALPGCDFWKQTPDEIRGYSTTEISPKAFDTGTDTNGIFLLAGNENNLTLVWAENSGKDKAAIRFAELKDKNWVTNPASLTVPISTRLVSAVRDSQNKLHVLWLFRSEEKDNPRRATLATFDEGKWQEPKNLYKGAASVYFATMALGQDDTLHLIWSAVISHNSAILFRTVKNGQMGDLQKLALPSNESTFWQPAIATAPDGKIHVAYTKMDIGKASLEYQSADATGKNWSKPTSISSLSTRDSHPFLDVTPNGEVRLYFVSGKQNEMIGVSVNQDGAWSEPEVVAQREGAVLYVTSQVDATGRSHLSWMERSRNGEKNSVHFISGQPGSWADPIYLPSQDGFGYGIQTSVHQNALYLTWKVRKDGETPKAFWQNLVLLPKN